MLWLICACLIVGSLASWIHALQWGVPYGLLPLKSILRDCVGIGFFALLFGLVARLVGRLFDISEPVVDLLGASVAFLSGAAWTWLAGRNGGLLRGFLILCSGVMQAPTRPLAEAALFRLLEKTKKKHGEIYPHAAVLAMSSLNHIGEWNKTLNLLATIEEENLSNEVRAICVQIRERCERELRLDKPAAELMT